jgi:hypothetical protein
MLAGSAKSSIVGNLAASRIEDWRERFFTTAKKKPPGVSTRGPDLVVQRQR